MLAKTVMYEEAVRVPWLMRVPGSRKHRRIANPVGHIDLVPTVLDLMGKEIPDTLPGHSLCPLLRGKKAAEDHVFIEWTDAYPLASGRNPMGALRGERETPGNHVRTVVSPDGWKLSIHTQDHNQLFNLAKDPGETTNVYDVSANKPVIDALLARIRDWQARVDDGLALPEA